VSPDPVGGTEAERAIDRAIELIDARIGMRPDRAFRNRLGRCITNGAAVRTLTVHDYVESLATDTVALQELLNHVTVQETAFFRHPAQFDVLVRDVLPGLVPPVTIWCAATANGQEAYSLAMVLEERDVPGTVVASDISTAALERTATGWYSDRELSGLSPGRLGRYLTRVRDGWEISPSLRQRVRPMRHNLLDPIPDVVTTCPIVFCRNVLIYFSSERTKLFLAELADRMPRHSYLFVGGSETLWQLTDRFEPAALGGAFVYRPCPPAAPKSDPPAVAAPSRRTASTRPTDRSVSRRAAPPRERRSPRVTAPRAVVVSPAAGLEREGHAATSAGVHVEAIAAFRKWAYLAPGDVMAHLNLGLALERSGDRDAARSAYTAARAALRDCDPATIEHALGGYRPEELTRLLDLKVEANGR
jgi:chemotaxis methyl-accepting protein methylase